MQSSDGATTTWAKQNILALEQARPLHSCPPGSDVELAQAYGLQRTLVDALVARGSWGAPRGYKSALTAERVHQAMGLSEPVIGVLFEAGERTAEQPILIDRPVFLETEIGFRLDEAIDQPVSAQEVKRLVREYVGVVELASPHLVEQVTGAGLVATNSASYAYITGQSWPASGSLDINACSVSLKREGQALHDAPASGVMGDQWTALAWLVNTTLHQGYTIKADQLLITGSIGAVHAATPGAYQASFGDLGALAFTLFSH